MAASQDPRTRGGSGHGEGSAMHRDVLHEILLRVPAKPLCRFRAVCRSWRSLLSAPSFAAAHATRHRGQPLLAICDWVSGSHYKTTEIKIMDTSGHVVKRFDAGKSSLLRRVWPHLDLVLIVRRVDGVDRRPLTVLDPATGAVTVLPGGHYDNTCSSFVFGKGEGDGKYKVLSLNNPLRRYCQQFCRILTVGGGGDASHSAWRYAPTPPVPIKAFDRGETIVAGGVVYHLVDSSNGWTIAAFDLETEQWRPDLLHGPDAPVPPASVNSRERRSLAEVNRSLAAVYPTRSTMELWLLMGSGERAQWRKRCRVVMSSVEWRDNCFTPDPVPLWVMDDGRVAFWLRGRLSESGTLWMYDPRTETCKRLANCLRIGACGYIGNLLRQ